MSISFEINKENLNQNHILTNLPPAEYERLKPFLEPVGFSHGEIIYHTEEQIEHVYFPTGGIISVTAVTKEGKTAEIGLVGREGMLGLDVILGVDYTLFESTVQISGVGFSVKAEALKNEFKRGGALQRLLLRYIHAFMVQSSQMAACNCLYAVEQRLVTWMLKCFDRIESDHLPLTQDFIATILGVNRPTVSESASKLQSEGLISYTRGKIKIIDPKGLEKAACDCYQTVKSEYEQFLRQAPNQAA